MVNESSSVEITRCGFCFTSRSSAGDNNVRDPASKLMVVRSKGSARGIKAVNREGRCRSARCTQTRERGERDGTARKVSIARKMNGNPN